MLAGSTLSSLPLHPPTRHLRCFVFIHIQGATAQAFADGYNLVEVEFPPLQADFLEDSGSSAYDVSSANVRLASRFAQSFAADGQVGDM